VEKLEDAGVFTRRRAVPAVARALRVSRSTVYDLLARLRRERARIPAGADAS
jgi:predicted transcriptional regulator YheO